MASNACSWEHGLGRQVNPKVLGVRSIILLPRSEARARDIERRTHQTEAGLTNFLTVDLRHGDEEIVEHRRRLFRLMKKKKKKRTTDTNKDWNVTLRG